MIVKIGVPPFNFNVIIDNNVYFSSRFVKDLYFSETTGQKLSIYHDYLESNYISDFLQMLKISNEYQSLKGQVS